MIIDETKSEKAETTKRTISAETVLSYVVIGCWVVAVLGILSSFGGNGSGVSLLAAAAALSVIAYIYRR